MTHPRCADKAVVDVSPFDRAIGGGRLIPGRRRGWMRVSVHPCIPRDAQTPTHGPRIGPKQTAWFVEEISLLRM